MSEFAEVIFGLGTKNVWIPNWTRLLARSSLDDLARYLEVDTSIKDRPKIAKHQRFGVYYSNTDLGIGRRAVATGYVDNINLDSSAKDSQFTFNGRSAARDIIDSKWTPLDSYENMTLFKVTKALASRFNIDCISFPQTPDPTAIVESFSFEVESPWRNLQLEAANQGFIITSSQTGGLYVWRVPRVETNQWGFQLTEGQNIRSFKDQDSGASQFYKYIFRAGLDEAVAYDKTCPQTARILTVNLNDPNMTPTKLQRRVETEIRRRRERRITVTLGSWTLPASRIRQNQVKYADGRHEVFWEVNFLTPVQIPSLGIEGSLLTSQVELRADRSTMSADVQLSRPEEYL